MIGQPRALTECGAHVPLSCSAISRAIHSLGEQPI
jgi:hypothetical protein